MEELQREGKVRFLLIDVYNDRVKPVLAGELPDFYKALQCDCIQVTNILIGGKKFLIIIDDEGALKDNIVSAIDVSGYIKPRLFGNIMVANNKIEDGEFTDISKSDIEHVKKYIRIIKGKPLLIVDPM